MEAEAKAFEAGLLFAKDIGIQDLILKGDSITVHRAFCEMSTPPSSVGPVIEGMHTICKDLRYVEFSHVRRQGNKPAHLLAKHALGIVDFIA